MVLMEWIYNTIYSSLRRAKQNVTFIWLTKPAFLRKDSTMGYECAKSLRLARGLDECDGPKRAAKNYFAAGGFGTLEPSGRGFRKATRASSSWPGSLRVPRWRLLRVAESSGIGPQVV